MLPFFDLHGISSQDLLLMFCVVCFFCKNEICGVMKNFLKVLVVRVSSLLMLVHGGVAFASPPVVSVAPPAVAPAAPVAVAPPAVRVNVGDAYCGGMVVYILQPGDPGYSAGESHGLIVAKEDLPDETLSWREAKAAAERLEISGNKGWSLPDERELSLLYQNKDLVGGFREFSYYWSGSEVGGQKAVTLDFYNGDKVISAKEGAMLGVRRARPVRKF